MFQANVVGRESQHLEQKVYLSISGLFQKKNEHGRGNTFVNSQLKVLGLSLKFWKK